MVISYQLDNLPSISFSSENVFFMSQKYGKIIKVQEILQLAVRMRILIQTFFSSHTT